MNEDISNPPSDKIFRNRLILNFEDDVLEKRYYFDRIQQNIETYLITNILLSIQGFYLLIMSFFSANRKWELFNFDIIFCCLCTVNFALLYLKKYQFYYYLFYIKVFYFTIVQIHIYSNLIMREPNSIQSLSQLTYISQFFITIIIFSTLMTQVNYTWYMKAIYMVLSLSFINEKQPSGAPSTRYYSEFMTFSMTIFFYVIERREQIMFMETQLIEQSEKTFLDILRNKLPISVAVVSEQKQPHNISNKFNLEFANTICQNEFKSKEQDILFKQIKGIKIQESQSKIKNIEYALNRLSIEQFGIPVEKQRSGSIRLENFEDFIEIDEIENSSHGSHQDLLSQKAELTFYDCEYQDIYQEQQENKEGLKIYFNIHIIEILWQNHKGYLILMELLKEKYLVHQKQVLDQFQDQLINTVVHNLKTPLNLINLKNELALKENNIINMNKFHSSISRGCQLLQGQINEMVDYTKINNNTLRLQCEEFNFGSLIEEVKYLLSENIQQSVQIVTNIDVDEFKLKIRNDRMRIHQILVNLIGNSMQYTFKGSISLMVTYLSNLREFEGKIDSSCRSDEEPLLKITITDTGIGMKQQKLDRIQLALNLNSLNSKNKQKSGKTEGIHQIGENFDYSSGSGLGLLIVRNLLNYVGNGMMDIVSTENQGTSLIFFIKCKIENILETKKNSQSALRESISFSSLGQISQPSIKKRFSEGEQNLNFEEIQIEDQPNYIGTFHNLEMEDLNQEECRESLQSLLADINRILVVDDTVFNIIALQQTLQEYTWAPKDQAYNGLQALQKYKESVQEGSSYDIIFMDVNMPLMNGFQSTKEIKDYAQSQSMQTIIIIVTAFNDEKEYQSSKMVGADYFLTQPLSISELVKALKKIKSMNS